MHASHDNPNPPSFINPSSATTVRLDSSPMAATAVVFILVLLFIIFFSVIAHRFFARVHTADMSHWQFPVVAVDRRRHFGFTSVGAAGLDPTTVRAMRVVRHRGGVRGGGCAVCLAEYEEKERVKVMEGCGHVFHAGCIDVWLVLHGSCPICRCEDVVRSDEVCVDVSDDRGEGEEGGEGKMGRNRSFCGGGGGGGESRVTLRRTCSV